VAIARFVMRNKQYTAAIRAENGRLVMSTLSYADEVIDPAEIDELSGLDDIDVSEREVRMAESLVESLSATFEPEKYRDEYREQVLDLIKIKAAGEEFTLPEVVAEKPKVVDLMAALEASVRAAKDARSRHPAAQAESKPAPAAKPAKITKAATKTTKAAAKAPVKEAAVKKAPLKKKSA
jgi:DNA end-binding protein Ku